MTDKEYLNSIRQKMSLYLLENPKLIKDTVHVEKGLNIVDTYIARVDIDFTGAFVKAVGDIRTVLGVIIRIYDSDGEDIYLSHYIPNDEKERVLSLYNKELYKIIDSFA